MAESSEDSNHPTVQPTNSVRIGLALAGGGMEGAVYEIGALRALEEVLEGVSLNRDVHCYVGVSAGAFIASCLANDISTAQLCRAIFKDRGEEHPLVPSTVFRPAVKEMGRRSLMVPRLLAEALRDYAKHPGDVTLAEALMRLVRALPAGVFDGEPLRRFLARSFERIGRSDDFRTLGRKLYVVAADLDSGDSVRFGEPGFDHVPISQAVQASTAVPGLYPPVLIDGRHYVDGVLLKTLHASVAVDAGANLLICVNPIVPVDTVNTVKEGVMRRGKLIDRGLPTILSQTFRTLIHSRLNAVLEAYEEVYPGVDLILLEPPKDDYRMFFTNIFSLSDRKAVCDHAYKRTREQLWARRNELSETFARHGIEFRADRLEDLDRSVWNDVDYPKRRRDRPALSNDLHHSLDRLEQMLSRIA